MKSIDIVTGDLFGFVQPVNPVYTGKKRKPTQANGYAATPGTGSKGETCKTCDHHIVREFSKRYHKCDLINWTCGTGTDIRVRSPACHRWEPIDSD